MARAPGRERREAEGLIAYWDRKHAAAATGAAVSGLAGDLGAMRTPEWSHRFIIGLGATEDEAFLLRYGADFARVFGIPPESEPLSIAERLPNPHREIFLSGCRDAIARNDRVLLRRVIDREDGRREMIRSCFIPVAAAPEAAGRFVLGAYNSRIVDRAG